MSSERDVSYSFLGEEAPPDWGADSKFSEAIQGMLSITPETNHKSILVIGLDAILSSGPASLTHPLARCPQRLLHLAALGHFQAIERVAVRAEEASHKVVATAELPTLGVKLLPPIFVVAVSNGGLDLVRSSTFARLFTLAEIYVVQSISLAVGAEPSHEVALFAHRPRKLVEEV
jgi:hypothetical protein